MNDSKQTKGKEPQSGKHRAGAVTPAESEEDMEDMEDMTVKTEIGYITGTPDVLNEISNAFGDKAVYEDLRGNIALSERANNVSFDIYYALHKIGFYEK